MTTDNINSAENSQQTIIEPDLGAVLVLLLKGVLYEDVAPKQWSQLLNLQNQVRDYVSVIGLDLHLDEAEGYAFLASCNDSDEPQEAAEKTTTPRLIARRQLSFPISLLLALLRKKLAEFDASGDETRLILTRDDIVELMRLFHPESTNEAKLVDQIERNINKVVELGFLRKLKATFEDAQPNYEVRRIIKSFVDGQWLSNFDARLEEYQQHLTKKTATQ